MKLWFIVNDLKMGNKQKNGSFQVPEKIFTEEEIL